MQRGEYGAPGKTKFFGVKTFLGGWVWEIKQYLKKVGREKIQKGAWSFLLHHQINQPPGHIDHLGNLFTLNMGLGLLRF
jgi:hypothetical protein